MSPPTHPPTAPLAAPPLLGDRSYAVLELLHFCQSLAQPVTFITRLRLDAALYEPAAPRLPGQQGRPRLKGARLPTLQQRLQNPATPWTSITVPWYDKPQPTFSEKIAKLPS